MGIQRSLLIFILVILCLGVVQFGYSATLGYGFTKVESVRTNGVYIRAVYQSDTSIVLDTVSYHHPFYGDGYFSMSRSGLLPAGKYDVHFEYGNYFRNKTINYDPEIGPVNMGNVDLVRVEYYSDDTIIVLRNSQMEVVLKRQNGIIRGLTVKGHSGLLSLTEPGQIILRDTLIANEYQQNNGTVTDIDTNITSNRVRVVFEVNFPYHKAIIDYTMDTLTLRWDNEVWLQNVSPSNDRALRLDFSLPLLDKMDYLFWANENAPLRIGDSLYKTIAYRHNWCILPVVILYDTTLDYGLSFVCPFEVKKPALSFRLIKNSSVDTFRVSYNYLRMGTQNSRHAQASLYIVPHEGDWRPGLAWMRNRYPEYFDVNPNSNTLENEGRFFFGGYYDTGADMDTAKSYGVKWEEYYSHHPFFGLYAPQDREQWLRIPDGNTAIPFFDPDSPYYDWYHNAGDHQHSYHYADSMIDEFNLHGIGSYNYFQSMEAWINWILYPTTPFDSSIAKDKNGNPLPSFMATRLMNPDTNLYSSYPLSECSWSAHIDSQCTAVLDSYPQAAGIFLDRDDYQEYDYAHNDSVSMINTTPVYMLAFALEEINEKICREVHNRNKSIIANGPSGIEVCKNMDAIMSEGYFPPLGSAQYLGLSRPMILMVADKKAKETELKDKSALYTGYFPSFERIIDNPQEGLKSRFIDRKYNPLFELYRGREWVLYPHALRLPVGIKGNIFKALNDDLLIPMVSMEKTQLLPDPFVYNLKINISVPDLNQYDHCYILSGDYVGPRWIFYSPSNQEFLTIPEHMVSSLIQLSKDPRYEYSLVTLPVQVRGRQGHFRIRVQNLEPGRKTYTLSIVTPFGTGNIRTFRLNQYEYTEVQYDFKVPGTHLLKEDSFLVINTAPTPDDTVLFTNWIVDPVSFGLPEKLFIKFPAGDSFNLIVVNNTVDTMERVRLGYEFIQGHGKMEWEPKPFRINPFETKKIPIEIDVRDTCGIIKIIATSNGDNIGSITRSVRRAMRPTPGDIFFDDFNSGRMSEQWHLWEPSAAWSVEDSSAKGSGNYYRHFATVGAGNTNWTNYRFQMNTKSEGSTNPYVDYLKSYLFFRVKSDTQYYRFGIKGDEKSLPLTCRDSLHGWKLLARYWFQPQKDVWYNLAVRVQGSNIRCYLNGDSVIGINDTKYTSGGIGIGTNEDYMTNYYDDILVRPIPWPETLFADNFNSGEMSPLWVKHLGNWDIPQDSGFVRASGGSHFATVGEDCDWTNIKFYVKIRIKGSETVSSLRSYMFFRTQDTLNYYRLGIYDSTGLELHKREGGKWIALATWSFKPVKDIWYNLKIEIQSAQIKCYLNDTLRITYTDNANPFINGGIGIGVLEQDGMVVDYDDILVQRHP
ncbi:MAG: hypothetical protein ABIL74_10650 [candidate division WOR-3 bacterium]